MYRNNLHCGFFQVAIPSNVVNPESLLLINLDATPKLDK
jgi:hypothetical protein